jgi:hypothetical protein
MSRILITENATIKRELVAPITTINWDPVTDTGTLNYQIYEMLYINGEFIKSTHVKTASVTLTDMVQKVYSVEVEPGVSVDVPGGLVMLAFKKAFEEAILDGNLGYVEEIFTE